MKSYEERYKRAVKLIQKLTDHSKFIHLFCGISILLLSAKELLLNKSLEVFNILLIATIFWILLVVTAKISYRWYLKWPILLKAEFVEMLIIYALAIYFLVEAVFFNASPEGAIFLLSISSALTETPYKNEKFDD